MPPTLTAGDHVFQAQGITHDNIPRIASVPITLLAKNIKVSFVKFDIYFTMNSYFLDPTPRAQIRGSNLALTQDIKPKPLVKIS